MLDIKNETPFEIGVLPGLDKDGCEYAITVIKGTFDIVKDQDPLPISENQIPIVYADEYFGEVGISSTKYESDTCLRKKGTDILLIGHAFPKNGKARMLDVTLQVGQYKKTIYVFGTRVWYRSIGTWKASDPLPFDKMPLIYEKAFGGEDTSHSDPQKHSVDKRNPIGTGYSISGDKEKMEGLPLPNLEDPRSIIKSWKDKPPPAGFGFIGRDWLPRANFAGTYDDNWLKTKCPLLPDDFDDLFYNGASSNLIVNPYLEGGESVKIVNASRNGNIFFNLPKISFDISIWFKGERTEYSPILDTVIIEPDDQKIVLIWRSTVLFSREFLYIDRVKVQEKSL